MPIGLDGQWNLAALQVPGVYIDIIPPSPNLTGAATNIIGVVGVASWGPTNTVISVSAPNDCATKLGVPQIRNNDIAWHIWAACQIGGAAAFNCVRVTDGTDVAATGVLQNAAASGTVTFVSNPTASTTITLGGTAVTFVASGATGNQVNIGGTLALTLTALAALLNASADVNLSKCSYVATSTVLIATYKTAGTSGNSFTLATNVTGATVSGATLSGGGPGLTLTGRYTGTLGNNIQIVIANGTKANSYLVSVIYHGLAPEIFNNITGSGNAFWTNLANAINNGTPYRGPSNYVVATAGALTAAPVVGTNVTLSGGTDGASGVTDTTLLGNDVAPRTGMFALRNSGVDTFTLVDLQSNTYWPAIDSFALSEAAMACVTAPSGTSITGTVGLRTAVGLDDFTMWVATGDWPSMYDSQNQVVRLVNPTAAMIGFCGNASPEQSPLNKILRGIVMTETSQEGSTYANADIQNAEVGGIDLIVGPPTTIGGDYYSFITGRNAWSNTGGNGVEYTRVTNFIARSLQSFATGSIVGMLQSIRPDDPTRLRAKQMLDGFFAQLADPNSGSSGQGIIDTWSTVCDLTNNPPASQALGYLFATCKVRYLNVVRYFVIRLAGGGNVTVTSSTNAPTTQSLL